MSGELMSKPDRRDIPADIVAEMEALAALPDSEIDFSDIPEITDFSGFRRVKDWDRARRLADAIPPEVVDWFEAHAKPGETGPAAINRTLREVMARDGREAA